MTEMPDTGRRTAQTRDPQENVVAFLASRGRGNDIVEVIETHAARVFLLGAEALKLKRAVRYSYLDYSTPARRRAACEAELAVNRRFAPSLYLAVKPVVRDADGRLHLGPYPGADAVDWVVAMRRFPQEDQLDHIAERGALTRPLLFALAERIATLHGQAERRGAGGGAAGIARAIDITIENLRPEAGRAFAAEAVVGWIARIRAALQAQGPLLDRRRHNGHVRACHGDLHLRNICLIDGAPTPFDAIEFNEDLSAIDVLYDLAFLLMDLPVRDIDGAANLLLNRYLDMRAEEEDGLAALPLFLSLRAAIRAQVSAAASRRTHDPHTAQHARDEAARYLQVACDFLEPREARLVAIGGLSGTGKSTLAYALAPRLGPSPGARVLRTDVLRKRAAGLPPEARLPPSAYTRQTSEDTYRRLARAAATCLACGHATIMDAVFATDAERSAAESVARTAGVRFDGIWLEAPVETMTQRVQNRGIDASDATADVLRAQLAAQFTPPARWRRIDAGMPRDDVERSAVESLLGASSQADAARPMA